ncbi:hypothetical protein ACU639_14110 [Streptomyces cynarae]|uniref:hypothetical protein n=1 Tax=Streptomyces cynarae TaxID=2981134 RepID=UPI00406C496C
MNVLNVLNTMNPLKGKEAEGNDGKGDHPYSSRKKESYRKIWLKSGSAHPGLDNSSTEVQPNFHTAILAGPGVKRLRV